MSWVLYEFSRPKINAKLRAAWVCDKILSRDHSNETSSALFIGDWLLEKWKLKSMLASESWFPVDEKKGVVTIGLNKPKGFWKSSSSSSSSSLFNEQSHYYSLILNYLWLLYFYSFVSKWAVFMWFKNEQECIIRFENSRRSREFLNLLIHDCEFFERLQNLWYRSTYSCTNI